MYCILYNLSEFKLVFKFVRYDDLVGKLENKLFCKFLLKNFGNFLFCRMFRVIKFIYIL